VFQIGVKKIFSPLAINTAIGRVPQPASNVALRPRVADHYFLLLPVGEPR